MLGVSQRVMDEIKVSKFNLFPVSLTGSSSFSHFSFLVVSAIAVTPFRESAPIPPVGAPTEVVHLKPVPASLAGRGG